MTQSDNYRLLDQDGKVIAVGTKDQMLSFVKHHVADGRYRIVGDDLKLHCHRKDRIVEPDPDGVCLEMTDANIIDLLDGIVADPPYDDDEADDDEE